MAVMKSREKLMWVLLIKRGEDWGQRANALPGQDPFGNSCFYLPQAGSIKHEMQWYHRIFVDIKS